MTEVYVDLSSQHFEEPTDLDSLNLESNLFVAMEAYSTIHQGLSTLKPDDFKNPKVIASLEQRIAEVSAITGVSGVTADLVISSESVMVSTEGGVIDIIVSFIEKIVGWLESIATWINKQFRKLFGMAPTAKAQAKASTVRVKAAEQQAARGGKSIPDSITIKLPGSCYLLFHSNKHTPKVGYVYNQQNIDTALENVPADWKTLIDAVINDTDGAINLSRNVCNNIKKNSASTRTIDQCLKDYKLNRELFRMANDHFEVGGCGVTAKPMRNSNRYHQMKFRISNLTSGYGWGSADGFTVKLDTAKITELNDRIQELVAGLLTQMSQSLNRFHNSEALKDIRDLLNDRKAALSALPERANGSSDETSQASIVKLLEITTELTGQAADNLIVLSNLFGRYVQTWTTLSTEASKAVSESIS